MPPWPGALTAAPAFTAGAWWLHHELYDARMDAAREQARATLDLVVSQYARGGTGERTYSRPSDEWVLVDSSGRFVDGSADLEPFVSGSLGPVAPGAFLEQPVLLQEGAKPGRPSSQGR